MLCLYTLLPVCLLSFFFEITSIAFYIPLLHHSTENLTKVITISMLHKTLFIPSAVFARAVHSLIIFPHVDPYALLIFSSFSRCSFSVLLLVLLHCLLLLMLERHRSNHFSAILSFYSCTSLFPC